MGLKNLRNLSIVFLSALLVFTLFIFKRNISYVVPHYSDITTSPWNNWTIPQKFNALQPLAISGQGNFDNVSHHLQATHENLQPSQVLPMDNLSLHLQTIHENSQPSQALTPLDDVTIHLQPIHENSQPSPQPTLLPLHELQYDLHPPLSKDLIVHTAYFDHRPRDNHTNVTIIFLTINRTIMDSGWVIGCGVDDKNASSFSLYWLYENYLLHEWLGKWLGKRPFLYENMELLCYDMPGKNKSDVFVIYKNATNSGEIKVTSLHPLFIPAPRVTPHGEYNFTTVVCSKIHNRKVTFLHEFVQYQRTIGVDHIHFSILDYFIKDKGFQDLVVGDTYLWQEYTNGYLSFSVWQEWYADSTVHGGENSLHSEILRKLGCMYRYLGTYDYVMPLDTDDFFVPRIPGKTKVKDYILQFCYHKPAGSCSFYWFWYFPQCGLVGDIVDGNVTNHLKTKVYSQIQDLNFKSAHSLTVFQDSSFHNASCPKCLRPGYHVAKISKSVAYFAHNRYEHDKYEQYNACRHKGAHL